MLETDNYYLSIYRASNGGRSILVDSCTFHCCSTREPHIDDRTHVGRMLNPSSLHHTYNAAARTCRVRILPCTVLQTYHKSNCL